MTNFYYDAQVGNGAFFKRENNRYNYFALYRIVAREKKSFVKHFKGSSVYSEPIASNYSIYFRYCVERFHLNRYLKLATPQCNNILQYSTVHSSKRNQNLPFSAFYCLFAIFTKDITEELT